MSFLIKFFTDLIKVFTELTDFLCDNKERAWNIINMVACCALVICIIWGDNPLFIVKLMISLWVIELFVWLIGKEVKKKQPL